MYQLVQSMSTVEVAHDESFEILKQESFLNILISSYENFDISNVIKCFKIFLFHAPLKKILVLAFKKYMLTESLKL